MNAQQRTRLGLILFLSLWTSGSQGGELLNTAGERNVNHIKWLPWSQDSFRKADTSGRLILLSITTTWCQWCRKMDRETYSDPRVIKLVNERFVPIRVDRDRRPDIDARYQAEARALTGGAGWPLTGILTPDGKLLFGGSLFPAETTNARMGLLDLLPTVADSYSKDKDGLAQSIAKVRKEIVRYEQRSELSPTEISPQTVKEAFDRMVNELDRDHGSLSPVPEARFPIPWAIELALWIHDRHGDPRGLVIVERILTGMALGGIHDHVGGGFYRYTEDIAWSQPHYEKLLSVNAGLLLNFLHAYKATDNALYKQAAESIIRFADSVLADTGNGGFFASQCAYVEDRKDTHTWTRRELKKFLNSEETRLFFHCFGIPEKGPLLGGQDPHVLHITVPIEDAAEELGIEQLTAKALSKSAITKLRHARSQRPQPPVDTIIITDWNALMVSAYLEASVVLNRPDCREYALRTLDLLINALRSENGVMHHYLENGRSHVEGLLSDQVITGLALLDAYQHTGQSVYIRDALDLANVVVEQFWDHDRGGFFDITPDPTRAGSLSYSRKEIVDGELPASSALAALFLDRLAVITDDEFFAHKSRQTLECFAQGLPKLHYFASTLGVAMLNHIEPAPNALIYGRSGNPQAEKLRLAALKAYRPGRLVLSFDEPAERPSQDTVSEVSNTWARVCSNQACSDATNDPKELRNALELFGRSDLLKKTESPDQ